MEGKNDVEFAEGKSERLPSLSKIQLAQHAASEEHKQGLWDALRADKAACFWSVIISTCIIMEGYDIVLVTSLFAQQSFNERYGSYSDVSKNYQVSAPYQSALGVAPTIGAIFGAFINGWLTNKMGYKKVLLGSLALMIAFIFILFFAQNLATLVAGLILCGVPWGVFATTAASYASEISSLRLRGYLTIYVNLCWAFGQLIAAGVLRGFNDVSGQWAYRIPFALQWIFPLPLAAIIFLAPESPWWLVRHGYLEEATRAVQRLSSGTGQVDPKQRIALMQHTIEIEDQFEAGTSYLDCFRGADLRRTEIACMTFAAQVWCGSSLGGTPAYFFIQAGLSSNNAFSFSVGGLGLACLGTIMSWLLISRIGRRPLYVIGLGLLAALMLLVGILASVSDSKGSSYAQASLVVLWLLIYYLTVGPVCYAIIAEVSAIRLRNKTVCLSRIAYYLSQIAGNVIEPHLINPSAMNLHGKAGYVWFATCLVFFIWAYLRLPETGKNSYEELDLLFAARVPSRKFMSTKVDPYAPEGERVIVG